MEQYKTRGKTVYDIARTVDELEAQRKELSAEIRRLKVVLWKRRNYMENCEEICEKRMDYYYANHDKCLEAQKKYYKTFKEKKKNGTED